MLKKYLLKISIVTILFQIVNHIYAEQIDTIFYDNFDTDKGWTVIDPYVNRSYWHKDTENAYSGLSWWCGTRQDTAGWFSPPGYGDNWVQYLKTPLIDLSSVTSDSVILSFMHNYSLETPNFPNDWDCCNLWASIDSGKSWMILEPDSNRFYDAKYNLTNSMAWHWTGLAPDWVYIPGWGGTNGGWDTVAFDLSSCKGEKLLLRFAVVSDPSASDQTYGTYHGAWYIDNISIDTVSAGGIRASFFYDDLDTDTTIVWITQAKEPSYHWHVTNQTGNWFWSSGMDSLGTFTWNQRDEIVSPPIALPDHADSCSVDFELIYPDPSNSEGASDIYYFEISEDSGKTWSELSTYMPENLYSENWTSYSTIYGYTSLINWLGKTVRFRISFYSDGDSLVGEPFCIDEFSVIAINSQGVDGGPVENLSIKELKLGQNYPNPFIKTTTIAYQLPSSGKVNLTIYNVAGQLVRKLIHAQQNAGQHSIGWDGRDERSQQVPNGVYLYRLDAGGSTILKRMIILK